MTAPSPTAVKYEYAADYRTPDGWKPLPVRVISPSVDKDRRAFTTATMTLAPVGDDTLALLDPRAVDPALGGQVRWRITQLDLAGNTLGWLPRVSAFPGAYAVMYVRTIERSLQEVTLDLHGAETMIDDRVNLTSKTVAAHPIYTGAQLVNWVLGEVFGSGTATGADAVANTYLAAKPTHVELGTGNSYLSMIESDMSSQGVRLVDRWGTGWFVADRDHPPTYPAAPTVVKLASYTDDLLPVDVDPIITGLNETLTRDGEWADGIIVRGDIPTGAYVERWEYSAGAAQHTRGRVVEIGGTAPSANLAASILTRTIRRGRDLNITARVRFDVLPGMTLEAHLRESTLSALITAVTWNLDTGTMNIRAQSAVAEIDVDVNETRTQALTPAGAYAAAERLARGLAPVPPDAQSAAWQDAQMAGVQL